MRTAPKDEAERPSRGEFVMFPFATEGEQLNRWRKLMRFIRIYGPGRTLYKAAGRLRFRIPQLGRGRVANIGLIGCGQFAFSTIGYYLRDFGAGILACYDINDQAARSLGRSLGVSRVCGTADELFTTPGLRLVYIASNHASHASYAMEALRRGLDVYVKKTDCRRCRAASESFECQTRQWRSAVCGL